MGNSRLDRARAGAPPNTVRAEWEIPYGMAAGANTGYGLIYVRHMHEYGTKPEQMAKMAVDQRFNALKNPNAVFQGQPLTVDDESREILGEINKIK
jgi:acetyl-CoA acetyltransferase